MDDDEREVELSSIAAIFPEIILDTYDRFSASIELPVRPTDPVTVTFPTSFEGPLPTPPLSAISGQENRHNVVDLANDVEMHELTYLPSLQLHITLPEGYPATKPPRFELSTTPPWLSGETLHRLQADGERMWEDFGHDQIVFAYIDHLQQAAENGFGVVEKNEVLQVAQEHKIALLDYDIKATQAAFDKETFDCGICLDPKKGTVCHKMIDCGHVFCVSCLQDFYNNAITEGDITSVRCLTPNCAKERGEAQVASSRKKPKTHLSPSELLQIPLEHEIVARYVKLKHKADLESDKNTIYCPRKWCQGAAKSKKHRKPEGLEIVDSEDESDTDDKDYTARKDLLSVCEDCSFAFCSRCFQGWHGEFTMCMPRTKTGELTEEDKASLEYLKLHTTPCPTCAAAAQKTHGCNHMICFKCNTHFCYLCSAWLEPTNPYKHYNLETTGCFQRLWELEGGDGDDVGIGFAGAARNFQPEAFVDIPDEEESDVEEIVDDGVRNRHGEVPEIEEPDDERNAHPERERPPVQREGPLVFRINVPPAPPPAAPMAPGLVNPPRRGNPRARGGGRQRRNRNLINANNALANNANADVDVNAVLLEVEAANRAWVQRFVQMALNDEEDLIDWDSDDEEDVAAWEIPIR